LLRGKEIRAWLNTKISAISSPMAFAEVVTDLFVSEEDAVAKSGTPIAFIGPVSEHIPIEGAHMSHKADVAVGIIIREDNANDIDEIVTAVIKAIEADAFPIYTRDTDSMPGYVASYDTVPYAFGSEGPLEGKMGIEITIHIEYHSLSSGR